MVCRTWSLTWSMGWPLLPLTSRFSNLMIWSTPNLHLHKLTHLWLEWIRDSPKTGETLFILTPVSKAVTLHCQLYLPNLPLPTHRSIRVRMQTSLTMCSLKSSHSGRVVIINLEVQAPTTPLPVMVPSPDRQPKFLCLHPRRTKSSGLRSLWTSD